MLAVSLQRFLQVMNALARLCNLRQVYLCVCVCARVCVPGQFFRCKVIFFLSLAVGWWCVANRPVLFSCQRSHS